MAKLNQKLFGNRNIGLLSTDADDKTGGEGLANISYVNGSGKSNGVQTATISAPDLPGGVQAVATVTITLGSVAGYTITEKGSGYSTPPTITVAGGGTGYTFTAILTTDQENAIFCYAKISDAITNAQPADIIKQRSTKRFKVKTASGTAICELKSSALSTSAATDTGKMTIGAVDSAGGTYFVTKIGSHKCTVTRGTGTQFATDSSVAWTFGSAVLNQSVTLANA